MSVARSTHVLLESDALSPTVRFTGTMPLTETIVATKSPSPTPTTVPVMRRARIVVVQLLLVVLVSLLLGGATSFAQTFLPDALRPFANSASGWTLLTALAVTLCRARTAPSVLFGAASFASLVLGYQFVSGLRGFPTDETLFLIIGLVVGPFVGVAASWLRRGGWRAILGCGILAGIALGEAAYGLILVSESTGWFYWTLIAVVGLALLAHTAVCQLHSASTRVAAIGLVLAVATGFYFAYTAVGQIMF
jgi:hypothetical protein